MRGYIQIASKDETLRLTDEILINIGHKPRQSTNKYMEQIFEYDTNKAAQLGIRRDPEHDLKHKGWDGIVMQPINQNGIIRFTAEKIVVDPLNPPKHITPVAE